MLAKEYAKFEGVHRKISFLRNELSGINAMMHRYAAREGSDPQVKAWMKEGGAGAVLRHGRLHRRLCTPRGNGASRNPAGCRYLRLLQQLYQQTKETWIADHIQELESLTAEASERRARYSLSDGDATLVPTPAAIDPRLPALFVEESRLVGVDGPRDEIVRFLLRGGPADRLPRRQVVAMVGFGGCGKTTLAKPGVQQNKVPI